MALPSYLDDLCYFWRQNRIVDGPLMCGYCCELRNIPSKLYDDVIYLHCSIRSSWRRYRCRWVSGFEQSDVVHLETAGLDGCEACSDYSGPPAIVMYYGTVYPTPFEDTSVVFIYHSEIEEEEKGVYLKNSELDLNLTDGKIEHRWQIRCDSNLSWIYDCSQKYYLRHLASSQLFG